MRMVMVLLGLLLVISACATPMPRPSPQEMAAADYGLFPESWKQITKDALAREMVRPEGLYIRDIYPPNQVWIITPDGEKIYGWGVCGFVVMGISKMEPFLVVIRDESPVYKALGFDLVSRPPDKSWLRKGIAVNAFNACPNLFRR